MSQALAGYDLYQTCKGIKLKRLSVTNLSSENYLAYVLTECSSHHQDESERSASK